MITSNRAHAEPHELLQSNASPAGRQRRRSSPGEEDNWDTNDLEQLCDSRGNAPQYVDNASYSQDNNELCLMEQRDVMNATPGGSLKIHCTFNGFDADPIVTWSFVPDHQLTNNESAESFLDSTTSHISDAKNASLIIYNVLYKHAGQYIVTVAHPQTQKRITSSCKVYIRPKLKRGLADLKAIVDGDNCTIREKAAEFFMEYGGFDEIPSQIDWFHDSESIDVTKWTVSTGLTETRIKSDRLKSVDEGQYTCRVADDKLGVNLESSATIEIQSALDVPLPAPRAGASSADERSPWITKALNNAPLLLKCPLPSVASEALDKASRVRMQWLCNGIQLYDSDWQTPDYFTYSEGIHFQDRYTLWTVKMSEEGVVLLATDRVRSVHSGRYSCRVGIDDDAYESSGSVVVRPSQQFVEQLAGTKVYLGEPVELQCRLEPWVAGNSAESGTAITWYHFENLLTPELQNRDGMTTVCDDGLCSLRIEKTSKRLGGIYRCEAKNRYGTCVTGCRLSIDQSVPPTILGPIQHLDSPNEDSAAALKVEYDAVPQPTVVWFKNGQIIKQGDKYEIITTNEESLLRILKPWMNDSGSYSVVIENVAGSADSSTTFRFDKNTTENFGDPVKLESTTAPDDRQNEYSKNAPASSRFDNTESKIWTTSAVKVNADCTPYNSIPMPHERRRTSSQTSRHSDIRLSQGEDSPIETHRSYNSFSQPAENETKRRTYSIQNQRLDNNKNFLLRPQSISASLGETVVFSCIIRPFPESLKIKRVSWRQKSNQFGQGADQRPRVTVKANNPYDGVFQFKLTNICEGDHGDYEVAALDEDDAEICSATFHLSVDDLTDESRQDVYLDTPRLQSRAIVGAGERLEVTCFISAYPIPQVFWFKDGKRLNENGSTNDIQFKNQGNSYQLVVPSVQPSHAGVWEVIGRNSAGLVMSELHVEVKAFDGLRSDSVTLSDSRPQTPISTAPFDHRRRSLSSEYPSQAAQGRSNLNLDTSQLNEQPPQFARLFRDQTARLGNDECNVTGVQCDWGANVTGVPTPEIRWQHNAQELQKKSLGNFEISNVDTRHRLVLKAVNSNFSGRYTMTAENSVGVAACSAMLTVRRSSSRSCETENKELLRPEGESASQGSPYAIHISPKESQILGNETATPHEMIPEKIINTRTQTPRIRGTTL